MQKYVFFGNPQKNSYFRRRIFHNVMLLAQQLGALLRKKGLTVATAESCTAGAISAAIASIDGSSSYHLGGIVSYAVSVKTDILGVPADVISKYGVVSSQTAQAMNCGVRRLIGADLNISVTGYAGSSGGDQFVPNGTVWICVSLGDKLSCREIHVSRSRYLNLKDVVKQALLLAIETVSEKS